MATDTSCRLSGNGYDTATEDSISMYYSFNESENDKTLENSVLDSTVEITIEESLKTVVKAPITTPIKGKLVKSLVLNSASSSTPSKMKGMQISKCDDKIKDTQEKTDEELTKAKLDNDNLVGQSEIPEIIIDSFQEMRIETATNTESSAGTTKEISNTTSAVVLKDLTSKIWPIDNKMEILPKEKDNTTKSPETQHIGDMQIPAKRLDTQHSLAEKMVQEIRSLLQGPENAKVICKGKENVEDGDKSSASNTEKLPKSAGKKIPVLKKPSRLSIAAVRRSILQADFSTKTITPATRIVPKSRQSISSLSSGIPTPSDVSSSSSCGSLKACSDEAGQTIHSRRSLLPSKRMSMFGVSKSSLSSIPESEPKVAAKKLASKRLSIMTTMSRNDTGRVANKIRSVVKTTLNSPVIARRDQMRRSINKLTSTNKSATNYPISVDKVDSTSKNTSGKGTSTNSTEKTNSVPLKSHISREDFVCEICSRSFRVASIFEAHKKTHNPAVPKETNTCKFCDKSFAISKALDKHLLENCLKIPLSERKKIKIAASQPSTTQVDNSVAVRSKIRSQRQSILPQIDRKNSRKSVAGTGLMPPPSSTKVVKTPMAHSGISKTPNKSVCCKPCEKTFDNVLSFAEHVLSHSNSSLAEE